MCWKWPPFASRQDWTRRAIFWKVLASTSANNKHSLLHSIPINFPTILYELTHYTATHKQQPYCVGTLSQMTERSAKRRVMQEKGWLAGGPLLRVSTIRSTTDTFLFISHTTNVLLFKFHCNIVIGVRIIKEMPGSVASGTPCITRHGHMNIKNNRSLRSVQVYKSSPFWEKHKTYKYSTWGKMHFCKYYMDSDLKE